MTPYGTPMPSPDAGAAAGGGAGSVCSARSSGSDSRARTARADHDLRDPQLPRRVLLVIGFAAMLVFAIWAVNLAFNSYQSTVTSEHAARYLDQGTKLYNQGNTDGAIEQWRTRDSCLA